MLFRSRALQPNGAPFRVFGTDYPTVDGTAIRDYVHVVDLADAHVAALEHLRANRPSMPLNLGSGRGTSVRGLLRAIEHVTGRPVPTVLEGRRAGDAPLLVADPSAAAATLAWRPRHSRIDEIVNSAWCWHQQHRRSAGAVDEHGTAPQDR